MYVDAVAVQNGNPVHKLHALDITTGAERSFSPVVVSASVKGTGKTSVNGVLTFNTVYERQRAGLLLNNGFIYIGYGCHCDPQPPILGHGWLFAFKASTLAQTGVWVSTPNGIAGGIWAGGGGPAADANNNVYFGTGNGDFNVNTGGTDYGDTVIKMSQTGRSVLDYFTPFNQATLDANDADLGGGGLIVLPDQPTGPTHLLIAAGKQGEIYLINRDNMGHYNSGVNNVVQEEKELVYNVTTPSFWNSTLFYAASGDHPKAFSFLKGRISANPTSKATETYPDPGSVTVVSANGITNGILWAEQHGGTASHNEVLHAYAASNLADELYNSDQAGTRDLPGSVANDFESMIVANGKVYIPTGKPALTVFGLLPGH